jgi:hypothetical protein
MELLDYIELLYNQRRPTLEAGCVSPAEFERRAAMGSEYHQ